MSRESILEKRLTVLEEKATDFASNHVDLLGTLNVDEIVQEKLRERKGSLPDVIETDVDEEVLERLDELEKERIKIEINIVKLAEDVAKIVEVNPSAQLKEIELRHEQDVARLRETLDEVSLPAFILFTLINLQCRTERLVMQSKVLSGNTSFPYENSKRIVKLSKLRYRHWKILGLPFRQMVYLMIS